MESEFRESEFKATKFYTDSMLLVMFECQNYCNTVSIINFGKHINSCKWQLSDRMTFLQIARHAFYTCEALQCHNMTDILI